MDDEKIRLNGEWVSVNAIREMLKIATRGDIRKSTYDDALEFGGEIYPELLAEDVSLIRRERQSPITKEYIQRAKLRSIKIGNEVKALELVMADIDDHESLIELGAKKGNKQLLRRLDLLYKAKEELEPKKHSENQLIFRDAYNAERNLPSLITDKASKVFNLPNENQVKIRVLHPEKPEHITGADLIYEYHDKETQEISLVFVQYKIWEERKMSITDERLKKQIQRLKFNTCSKGICKCDERNGYRFPFCSSFIRPTDALQSADQKLISTGEHLPICQIDEVKSVGVRGGEYLEYKEIKNVSISSIHFEELFNRGKIGSKKFSRKELEEFYKQTKVIDSKDTVIIYAQEY